MSAIILFMLLHQAMKSNTTPETVPSVDLNRYAGTWYEMASYPNRFQKGCTCTTATYSLDERGKVIVENRCQRGDKRTYIKGKASVVPNSGNAKLRVQFFWPFKGDYWIIDLAPDYNYAVVSNPSRKYLWILSRQKAIEQDTMAAIKARLQAMGFDLSKLQSTRQDCD